MMMHGLWEKGSIIAVLCFLDKSIIKLQTGRYNLLKSKKKFHL